MVKSEVSTSNEEPLAEMARLSKGSRVFPSESIMPYRPSQADLAMPRPFRHEGAEANWGSKISAPSALYTPQRGLSPLRGVCT